MQEVQDTADESKDEVKDERRYMDPQTYEDHKTAMEKDRQFFSWEQTSRILGGDGDDDEEDDDDDDDDDDDEDEDIQNDGLEKVTPFKYGNF